MISFILHAKTWSGGSKFGRRIFQGREKKLDLVTRGGFYDDYRDTGKMYARIKVQDYLKNMV
jgi:hypothetical protein